MTKKIRADELVVKNDLAATVSEAKRLIMSGVILTVAGEKIYTAGEKYQTTQKLRLKKDAIKKYVSRGGQKLAHALKVFDISLQGEVVLDIGASTGGFTDVALQNGAQKVYALDVGTNQLDWKLRKDPRVISMEQTNFRYAKLTDFKEGRPTFACTDVSFISLALIFPPLREILPSASQLVALIKPQFEAHPEDIPDGGVINDPHVYEYVLHDVIATAAHNGLMLEKLAQSPITGSKGNIEFLACFKKDFAINKQRIKEEIKQVLDPLMKGAHHAKTFNNQ